MITTETLQTMELDDAGLVMESLKGDREAFRLIVERHKNLIASLTYCATGNVAQSEDLAQETFLTAWRRLPTLREPAKLRPWLCGIARFLINKEYRRLVREPAHAAEPLDQVDEWAAPDPLPSDRAINDEERAMLWRCLQRIPEIYREPLVLFYRENQSIEAVAEDLQLTEDAVKQRLSRGRKLLQEQFALFVAGALKQTAPGKAFTVAVLASLPALTLPTTAKAAATGAAAKSGATAKAAGMFASLGALIGPLVVLLPNYLAYRATLAGVQSPEERAGVKYIFGRTALVTTVLFVPFAAAVLWLSRDQTDRSFLSGLFATALVLIYLPTMFILSFAARGKARVHYAEVLRREHGGVYPKPAWEYRSSATFLGLPLVHIRIGDRFAILREPVTAWIAIASKAVGGLFAFGGLAIAPLSIGGASFGLLSFGGFSGGIIAVGGIAFGVWTLFGGVLVAAWQSFGGCLTIGWNAASGDFALAHDYAVGRFAHAIQANNDAARQFVDANFFYQCARFVNDHWLWLMLLWIIPFVVMACIRRPGQNAEPAGV